MKLHSLTLNFKLNEFWELLHSPTLIYKLSLFYFDFPYVRSLFFVYVLIPLFLFELICVRRS